MSEKPKHPPYRVTCSCGKTATITFDEKKGEYSADKPEWTYSPETNWRCSSTHRKERAIMLAANHDSEDD